MKDSRNDEMKLRSVKGITCGSWKPHARIRVSQQRILCESKGLSEGCTTSISALSLYSQLLACCICKMPQRALKAMSHGLLREIISQS